MMVDLSLFSDENFDGKKWINNVCQSRHPQDPLENHLVDLEMKLQMISEEIFISLEEQSVVALLRVSRASRDVIRLLDDALLLRQSVASIIPKLKKILIRNIESEEQSKLELVSKQVKGSQVSDELFMILQQMQTNWVAFESKEDKMEALKLLDLDNAHQVFDELIQRASECVDLGSKGDSRGGASVSSAGFSNDYRASGLPSSGFFLYEKEGELFTKDDSYVSMSKSTIYGDGNGSGVRSRDGVVPVIVDCTLKSVTSSCIILIIGLYIRIGFSV